MAKSSEGKPIDAIIKETKEAMQIGTLNFAGRAIIYDAFRASMIDGLHPDEEKSIVAIATAFDLTEDLVGQLKALAAKEEDLRVEKAKLVTPGHPLLARGAGHPPVGARARLRAAGAARGRELRRTVVVLFGAAV